jgi:hypothetical protein
MQRADHAVRSAGEMADEFALLYAQIPFVSPVIE